MSALNYGPVAGMLPAKGFKEGTKEHAKREAKRERRRARAGRENAAQVLEQLAMFG